MKKIFMFGAAILTLTLASCGGNNDSKGTTNNPVTNPSTSIPSAPKAPTVSGVTISGGTISTYTDVIAKCTFVYSGTLDKTVVATRTEYQPNTDRSYKYSADIPSSITGNFAIVATCQNDKGTATKRLIN